MNNKQLGNQFERELCNMLSSDGFWSHRLQDNKNGQPADIIASKGDKAVLIDCKVCINGSFPLVRIEENQENAMNKWYRCRNAYAYFALLVNNEVWMFTSRYLFSLKKSGIKTLNEKDIQEHSIPYDAWKEQFT